MADTKTTPKKPAPKPKPKPKAPAPDNTRATLAALLPHIRDRAALAEGVRVIDSEKSERDLQGMSGTSLRKIIIDKLDLSKDIDQHLDIRAKRK